MLEFQVLFFVLQLRSATRSYAPERELRQGTQRQLGCRPQCLLLASAVCGSVPPS